MRRKHRTVAIDFDGTIYNNKTKELMPDAAKALKYLHAKGYILILWTCRDGNRLANAVNILKKYEIYECFSAVNSNVETMKFKTSNKIVACIYIDDRNLGGFPGWDKIIKLAERDCLCE